ncbi:MAG TPA: DUF2807 domain-containing protein [Bacteroidales bacterium]|nr:DUF2807 domain-containing protein [Bacteroidales bacterium]
MKKFTLPIFLTTMILMSVSGVFAQATGNGKVIATTSDLPFFNAIEAGGAIDLTLVQSDKHQLIIETDENLMPLIDFKVSNGTLKLSAFGIRKATKLEFTVLFADLNLLDISGATKAKSEGVLTTDMLTIKSSGATSIQLDLAVGRLNTASSGASKINLSGKADHHTIELSGASKLTAGALQTITTTASGSGAADALVNASDLLVINTTGVARVRYESEPARIELKNQSAVAPIPPVQPSGPTTDTVNVSIGNLKIRVIDGDSTVVEVGDRKLVVDQKGNVALKRSKRNKFNGHWAGFELGINGLLTSDLSLNLPKDYLDLRMEKSVVVNLNFYEQNIPLNKSRTFGIVSGLGLSWNNYRFEDNVMLQNENKMVNGYFIEGVGMKKSKLVNSYVTIPLFFELQTNTTKRKEKAHIAAGVVGGWRYSSHTKLYFLESNKAYTLRDENGNLVAGTFVSPGASRRNIVKDHNGFQQNPFKLDAGIRAGWGIVNLFANYSLTPLFIKDRGPEIYPFAVGITLTSF